MATGSKKLSVRAAKEFLGELSNLVKQFTHQYIGDTQWMFFALSLGKMTQASFDEQALQDLMLPDPGEARQVPEGQPFFLRAIAQTARLTGEEDADILDSGDDNYCEGRMVGYQHVFPRVPLVFRPKLKARQYDDLESLMTTIALPRNMRSKSRCSSKRKKRWALCFHSP